MLLLEFWETFTTHLEYDPPSFLFRTKLSRIKTYIWAEQTKVSAGILVLDIVYELKDIILELGK